MQLWEILLLHLCQGNIVTLYLYENSSSKREATVMSIKNYTSQPFHSPEEEIPTLLIHWGFPKLYISSAVTGRK